MPSTNVDAYGFVGLKDLYNSRVLQVGIQRVYDAIYESAAEYSRVRGALLADWVEPTEVALQQFELPGSGTLQPLDADGNPLPIVPSGNYQVAFPIQGAGTAYGNNRVSRALETIAEINRSQIDAEQRDSDWLMRHILAALFTNTTYTYNDEAGPNGGKGFGALTIQPLANNDAVLYKLKGATPPVAQNHFLAQAAAIDDDHNPFPTIFTELNHHPSNGNRRIIVYVATNLVPSIKALSDFVRSDLLYVNQAITVATPINPPPLNVGDFVRGTVDNIWIVEWGALPDGYMIAKVEGIAPLRMREYPAPELKGFFPENFSPDGNHLIYRLIRYAGFGVADRISALVMLIGNGSYSIPSGYTAPLKV